MKKSSRYFNKINYFPIELERKQIGDTLILCSVKKCVDFQVFTCNILRQIIGLRRELTVSTKILIPARFYVVWLEYS